MRQRLLATDWSSQTEWNEKERQRENAEENLGAPKIRRQQRVDLCPQMLAVLYCKWKKSSRVPTPATSNGKILPSCYVNRNMVECHMNVFTNDFQEAQSLICSFLLAGYILLACFYCTSNCLPATFMILWLNLVLVALLGSSSHTCKIQRLLESYHINAFHQTRK